MNFVFINSYGGSIFRVAIDIPQAKFICKWLIRLRPKLASLKGAGMTNIRNFLTDESLQHYSHVERYKAQHLDSKEFLSFLSI
jgi:hypothetical protein